MNELCKLLGIKYPIIQGGMANISDHKLASAVSNAGGLGIIAIGGWDATRVREEIISCRKLTDKPFGVNLMLMSPHIDSIVDVVIEEKVNIVTTGAGSPGKYMERFKEANITVIPVVAGLALAKRMQKQGADAIIVEGTEAGGHIGEITTMNNVPHISNNIDLPVIAAGGIASGKQIVAAYALGAVGVQVGTAFLVAEECNIHVNYKNAVIKAKDNSTIVTGRQTGAPVRVLRNKMAKEYIKIANDGIELHKLEELTLGSLRKAVVEGDTEMGSLMAGQSAGMITEIKSSKDIIEQLFKEADETLKRLGNL